MHHLLNQFIIEELTAEEYWKVPAQEQPLQKKPHQWVKIVKFLQNFTESWAGL